MNNSSTKIPFILAGVLAAIALNVTAEVKAEPKLPAVNNQNNHKKGMIMVVSEHGKAASEAAHLLAEIVAHNPGYTPLLMVPAAAKSKETSKANKAAQALKLSAADLPAVIFFNKAGKEIARVVQIKTAKTTEEDFKSAITIKG
jgi:hypothetical protein